MEPLMRLTLIALLACAAVPALADEHRASRVPPLPAYEQECASCHLAFPPGLLPAVSWQRLMNNLPRHYGVDASLDAATGKQIGDWLAAHAGAGRQASGPPPEDRITRGAWFQREHREVRTAVWKRPAVRSASNCGACHPDAAAGRYSEHDIRIPR
jgi:hypothetical protein